MTFETEISGAQSPITLYRWDGDSPQFIATLVHGYGEHAGRYDHVAVALAGAGAVVYAADYPGHGRSGGERALISDVDDLVADTERVVAYAADEHPSLPLVLIGHSLGGIVATRYGQIHGPGLAALVLSGPAIGGNPDLLGMVALPEIPDVPIDPAWLSRDPEVGRRYAADPLVYHGPFKRATLEALVCAVQQVATGGSLGDLPTLWVHGELDPLAPLHQAREAIERIRGSALQEHVYLGAHHEILNEIDKDEVIEEIIVFVHSCLQSERATQTASIRP